MLARIDHRQIIGIAHGKGRQIIDRHIIFAARSPQGKQTLFHLLQIFGVEIGLPPRLFQTLAHLLHRIQGGIERFQRWLHKLGRFAFAPLQTTQDG